MTPDILIKRLPLMVGVLALLIIGSCSVGNLFEPLSASQQMVIQYPDGNLETFTTPGWKPQMWGTVTKYDKRANFDFTLPDPKIKDDPDKSIEMRFNDAGHGRLSGTIAYEMPTDKKTFLRLHSLYGSQVAIESKLVGPVVTKVIYMTGPHMSSKESYAERRNELLSLIDDQIKHGVLATRSFQKDEIDQFTSQVRKVTVVDVVRDSAGRPVREDQSPLAEFSIRTFNLAINKLKYSEDVEAQIQSQQKMTMQVQTSKMEAIQAEQQRITTEQNGMAAAAKAKWEQEVEKATAVTSAEKDKAVAALAVQTAELEKRRMILEGEGEAAKKRLVMQANGALEQKLQAWVTVNQAYADAIAKYTGSWVPGVVMGESGRPGGASTDLINLLTTKTARDLALDISQK